VEGGATVALVEEHALHDTVPRRVLPLELGRQPRPGPRRERVGLGVGDVDGSAGRVDVADPGERVDPPLQRIVGVRSRRCSVPTANIA
jgi:hypothetical protein